MRKCVLFYNNIRFEQFAIKKTGTNVRLGHALVYSNCALCTTVCIMRSISAIKNHPPGSVSLPGDGLYHSDSLYACCNSASCLSLFIVSFSVHLISIRSSEPTYEAPSTTPCTIIRQSFFIIFGIHSLTVSEPVFFDINGETRC